jgi:two-component system nitrate/nitrite response regulator NarL
VAPTRILVADSHALFRTGVRNLLAQDPDLEVVEADDLASLLAGIVASCPDLALVDLDLPPLGGVEAVHRLRQTWSTAAIVWSVEPAREDVLDAVRAGADGFLRKDISPQGLVRALRGVAQGEAPLSRDLAALMIDALHDADDHERARQRVEELSSREREVLSLVADGARNKQIADVLAISEFTVKRHVQNILQKLELPSRRAAAAFHRKASGADDQSVVAHWLAEL